MYVAMYVAMYMAMYTATYSAINSARPTTFAPQEPPWTPEPPPSACV
jgi:hypothetical protein